MRDIWPACRVARMFCTVLMAEVVGEVEASLFLSFMMGLEECLSLLQVGLLGMSDSHEQLGEQGGSYLQHHTIEPQ